MTIYSVYGLWEDDEEQFGKIFIAHSDKLAVRHVVENHGRYMYWDKLKLWKLGQTFDVDNGNFASCDKYVIALPSKDEVKSMLPPPPPVAPMPAPVQ